MYKQLLFAALLSASNLTVYSQENIATKPVTTEPAPAKWYDKISLRGYTQLRYNRLLETNPDLKCDQCDKSIGKGQGLFFRRGRLVLSGNIHSRVFMYLQFDYSSDASATSKHFLQVRDAYFDYALNEKKTFRLRFGQSKVPFGFENLQSSQNRLPLDRNDALNSSVPNERDLGVYAMYAPEKIRKRFKMLVDQGLKGSGDYGAITFGVYNGQAANKPELNDNLHTVARMSYPFQFGKQIIEPGIYGYTGDYTMAKDQLSSGVKVNKDLTYKDQRGGASLTLYAQPIGIVAEYNVGKSPSYDSRTDSIQNGDLKGGQVIISYRQAVKSMYLQPYLRYQKYDGAKKLETDARFHHVEETEFGVEWQINHNVELTVAYAISNRKFDAHNTAYDEKGRFLRLQMQFNY